MHFQHRLLALILTLALGACAHLEPLPLLPSETVLPVGETTALDKAFAPHEAAHPQQSAFRLLKDGPEAFVTRVQSARLAGRSLDVQTYIWHGDTTGMYLVRELLAAADRGVKVRLLVDDMDARAGNAGFAALAAHPNMSVRMFNPFASREGKWGMVTEGLGSFERINHRMHNKTWIADNRVAVAGGRNLGDEYFGASEEVNFVDLDFAMVGPVVRDASMSFDKYWNSPAAYPMEILDPAAVSPQQLEKLRQWLLDHVDEKVAARYKQTLLADAAVQQLVTGDWPVQWTSRYAFVSDNPLKATLKEYDLERSQVMETLLPVLAEAQHTMSIISPYFVPGESGTQAMVKAAQSSRQVRILTNSLAANDVAAVHGGYSRYRKTLLEGGVRLWELKPLPGSENHSTLFGSTGASLHTKAFIIDGTALFVGSYNLDQRSTWLNCEQGVLVYNEVLARELTEIFDGQIAGRNAWQVTLDDGKLKWNDGNETFDSDPKAGASKKFQAWMTRVLHLDAQL